MNLNDIEKVCLEQVVTIAEVAAQAKVSKKRVRDLCLSGGLVARQSGSVWLISRTSVEKRWRYLKWT